MPRPVESHELSQRVTAPRSARLHLCGAALVVADADADGPWRHQLLAHPDPAAARLARDRKLTALSRTGYHVLTSQRFTVPATAARDLLHRPDRLDEPFERTWAAAWAPALAALDDALTADAGPPTHLVLLANYPRHTTRSPWGPALATALEGLPHALHEGAGLLLAGVGPVTLAWLRTYYAAVLEKTPPSLPAHHDDTSLTYTFALGLWQPDLDGPLARLAQALDTARDMTTPS